MAKNNEEKKKESPTKWAESTKDGIAKGVRIYGDVRVSDEDTRDRKVFKNYSSTAGASSPASGIQARNQRNRLGIGLSRFNQLAGASSFEEYAKMRRQQEEAEGMRSAADKLGGMFTAHQKAFSPNDSRTAKILPAEQEAMDKAAERGARIAAGESTFEQEMKAAQAEREAKADPVTVQTPQQAAAEALMRNYGYKTIGNQTVFVTPFSPLPTPTKENTATKASAPFAFDIDPDQYVKDMMAIDRGMGFQAGAKNYKLDPNDPFADLKRQQRVAASGAMMEPTIDDETQKILDTYFGGKLPSMDEFNAKYEELYDDVRLTDEEVAYFYHRGSELVGNALNAAEKQQMDPNALALDEETQAFVDRYFGGQIPTADEFNEKYEQIYDGTGVSDEYVKAFEEGAGSVEKAIRDAQAYGSAYGDAMIEYGQALGRLGYDAKDYAGLNGEAGYYARYGLDYNRANVAQAYEDQYKMPGIMGSYEEHDATMQMIKNRGMDTQYSGTDLETGRTLLQREMDDKTAQTYMYLASEYGEEAAQNYIDAMLKGEYNPRAWQIRDKALRAGANENWAGASLRTFASVPGQVAGTAYAIEQALKGEEIDPYDTAFMPAQLTQTPRDEVAQMITRNYGTTDENGQPVNNAQSYILNALYQAAMSSGDSTLAMLVSGGPHGGMAAATQGLWAWGSGAQDATMRGGSSAQAALLGGVQGLVEMATEALPMKQLAKAFERQNVKAIKDILLMALHGAISEAPGEGLSELGGALADKAIMDELSNWDAAVNEKGVGGAAAQLAGDVLTSMLVGALSGAGTNTAAASLTYGVGKGVDAYQQYRTNKLLKQAAQDLNEVQKQEQSAAQQPAEIPDELATGLEAEYAGAAEEVAENAPEAAEAAQSEAEQAQPEAEQDEEEKPAETPEKAENKDRFKAKKAATLTIDGENSAVDVVGVDSVSDTGLIMLEVEDQNGKRSVVNAADVSFADDASEELMGYAASERMDAKGLRSYMEGYDSSIATPEQYAEAYSSVYSRGRAGVDYDNAALNNSEARQYLSNDAMIAAYAAGENAYNQTHDTVQPAAIETASGNAAAPANAKLSAKEGVTTTRTRGRVSRQYSQAAFSKLGKEGRRNAMSQMELLGALASRTGHTIRVVDSLAGKDGKKANAMYNPKTREITVALDATGGAYAYAAAHELTHALRNEHKSEWNGFRDFVRGALERNGQVWEDLVKYQQDRFGYNREDAEEEVICNTVPALLKDERNLFELYKGNRTLFDRVVNWVKGLLEDVKNAGQALSSRSQSWAQMDALANDRKALQDIYDMMMRIMEQGAEEADAGENGERMSRKEQGFAEDKYFARKMDRISELKDGAYTVVGVIEDGSPLNMVGIPADKLYFDNSKIKKAVSEHADHIDTSTLKQIPKLLANPIAISQPNVANTVSVFGELEYKGTPIMVGVMIAKNNTGTASIAKVRTVHARRDAANQITDKSILYLNENKKETTAWFQARGIDVPLGGKRFGFIRSIHQRGEDVKFSMQDSEGNELTEEQQEYFAESKVRDDEGNLLVMYHGTTAYGDINVFKPGKKGWLGPGIYLTNKKSDAQHYADAMGPGNGKLYTMYANVKSPLYVYGSDPVPEIMRAAYGNDRAYNTRAAKQANSPSMLTKADITKLKGKGYDGIVWKFYRSVEISVFGPEQIKNIDNKAPTDNDDIRYSMQDIDDEYMAAVKAGDEETMIRMVDAAAAKAGYQGMFYHGSDAFGFTEFDMDMMDDGASIFLARSVDVSGTYTRNPELKTINNDNGNGGIYQLYARLGNSLVVEGEGRRWNELDPPYEMAQALMHDDSIADDEEFRTREIAAWARDNGYDSVEFLDIRDTGKYNDGFADEQKEITDIVALFNPGDVKSADLITYDAKGNVIPLSERFRNDSNDIRYSLIDSDDNVRDAAKSAQSAFGMIRGHYITAAEADKLAGSLLKASNSDYDRQRLAAEISRTMDYIERGEDVDIMQVFDELTSMGARVMEKSKTLDLEHEERAKPIRDYLKTTKIRLTDKQRAEAESAAGSYGAYRKSVFGRVRLVSTGGVPLDSAWQELSQMDPELFPEDAREGDMPALLQAAVDASKPVYHDGTGMTTEEGANWVALQLIDEYLKLPAVKAAVKNAKTFGESLTDLNKAVKRYKDSSWSEYQNALRAINEARDAKTKSEKQKELAAMRKKYKEWREKDAAQRRERELKRRYRARIEATVKQLTDWIAKPTDAKHIPAGLEDTIRRMLESLDFSGKDTKTAKLLSERLSNLADVLQRAQESGEENQSIYLERDQQMIDEIRRVAELIRGNTEFQGMEGRGIYDLNGIELKELSKWLDVIKHNVIEASKLRGSELPYESVDEAAQLSMMELSGKKPLKDKKWIPEKWHEFFGPDMWDSFSFFERLGATANEIFKGLRRGFDKMTQLTREAEVFTKKLLDGVDLKKTTGKKAEKITYTTTHGETLELTRGNIMEIYVLSRREQATGHMYGGGILIANSKDAMPKVLTKVDVAKLTGMLSKDELRIADGLQRFLSKEAAAWGNATSRKLVGYNKFGEEFYWPINTDPNTRMTTKLEDNYAADINAIKNQGMTKATVQGANNAIVIGDIFDTYVRHISNMAAYAAYAIPLSDFTRWYNARGVKTQIDHIMGKKGLEYINNFLMAVNGSGLRIDQSGLSRLSAKLTRNAKIASVGANLRVVIQQPMSYARAALMISPKYLTAALTMKAPKKGLIDKYCGIAQWKHWGFYETNIGPSLRGVIVNDAGGMEKAREVATWLAGKGDDWTLNHLWNACALEAKDRGYVEGSEGFYTFVGDRMSEIIDRTQVVDSVFHRSQIMRSKNPLNQMMTNFMSEPNKTFNMLMSAIEEYASNRKNKAAKIKLARTLATYAVTGVMTAAAAAVIDAFRDEDDEKEWLEKYGSALLGNVGDNLNPLGLLPGVKDVLSFIQGYSNSAGRMDTQSIQKIIWAADEIRKAINGESKMSLYGLSYKTAQALSSLFGLPVSNVMRDLNAIVQTATGRTITKNAEGRRSQTAGLLYDAMMGESKRDAKKLREELSGKAGMNTKEIDEQLAIRLAEEPEIAQAYEAKVTRDYATMNRIRNSFTARGFGSETFDRALEKYRNSYIKEKASEIAEDDLVIEAYNAKQAGQDATVEQKTKALMDRGYTQEAISEAISMYGKTQKDMDAQLESTLFTTDEAAGAIRVLAGLEKGTVTESDLKLMVSERVAASDAEDPEASAKSSIAGALKATYLDLDAKGDTAGMKRLAKVMKDQLGTEQAKLDGWVSDKRGEDLRAAVDAYDVGAAGKVVQKLRKEGSADSDIKARLKTYKEKYLEAVNRKDTVTANKIKRTLIGLGLMSKKGEPLYKEETFADWLKTK